MRPALALCALWVHGSSHKQNVFNLKTGCYLIVAGAPLCIYEGRRSLILNVPKESHRAGHLKRMSPQSLISILAILPISTATSWHLDQRFSPLQNFLKIFFWASLHSPLYACLPTKATRTVKVGNTVDAVNADKPINVSTLKQQLFEEHLPSLLHRGLKRRKQGVDDQQKVQEEVSLENLPFTFFHICQFGNHLDDDPIAKAFDCFVLSGTEQKN